MLHQHSFHVSQDMVDHQGLGFGNICGKKMVSKRNDRWPMVDDQGLGKSVSNFGLPKKSLITDQQKSS